MNFIIRKTHKYLSFAISLQLLLWTISGIYFAFNKIELVRGEQYLTQKQHSIDLGEIDFKFSSIKTLDIKKRLNEDIVIIKTANKTQYLDRFGDDLEKLSMNDAMEVVKQRTTLSPVSTEEILESERGSEFRGRSLPLYKVVGKAQDGLEINVYLNAYSGDVVAIRSNKWRIWDLMWGLHIMDWQDRDNIGNLLLKIFSILALISSITGIMLFFKLDIKNSNQL